MKWRKRAWHRSRRSAEGDVAAVCQVLWKKGRHGRGYSIRGASEFQNEALRQLVARPIPATPFTGRKCKTAGIKPQDIQGADELYRMPDTTKTN